MSANLGAAEREFLTENRRFCVLATINPDGLPQQSVMWFELRGDQIILNTSDDRVKMRNLRRDPRASICVEEGYQFVTVSGTVEFIDDHETTQADIYGLARRYNPDFKDGDYPYFAEQKRITIVLTPTKVISNNM